MKAGAALNSLTYDIQFMHAKGRMRHWNIPSLQYSVAAVNAVYSKRADFPLQSLGKFFKGLLSKWKTVEPRHCNERSGVGEPQE